METRSKQSAEYAERFAEMMEHYSMASVKPIKTLQDAQNTEVKWVWEQSEQRGQAHDDQVRRSEYEDDWGTAADEAVTVQSEAPSDESEDDASGEEPVKSLEKSSAVAAFLTCFMRLGRSPRLRAERSSRSS